MKTDKPPIATTHLYRGAPAVRGWSKYQATVKEWTLCGIRRRPNPRTKRLTAATEDTPAVNCPFCRQLMQPGARAKAGRPTAA